MELLSPGELRRFLVQIYSLFHLINISYKYYKCLYRKIVAHINKNPQGIQGIQGERGFNGRQGLLGITFLNATNLYRVNRDSENTSASINNFAIAIAICDLEDTAITGTFNIVSSPPNPPNDFTLGGLSKQYAYA